MASSKQLHRRMGRKRRLPKLNVSDENNITSIDIEHHHHYNDEQQYGNISEIDSVDSITDDKSSSISTYHYNHNNNIPHEHLLSDHTTSIDVLILERDMKNVLSSLDKLGILEDDFKSLALATTSEEEKDDDCGDTWPTLSNYHEQSKVETDGEDSEEENDWEVLSSADSVWSLASTGDTMSFRDALLQDPTGSTMIASSVSHRLGGEPKIFSAPLALYTRPTFHHHHTTSSSDPVVNLEMLENADLWTSIRDAINNFGARKEAFFTSGRS
jgi:hypothetical protein